MQFSLSTLREISTSICVVYTLMNYFKIYQTPPPKKCFIFIIRERIDIFLKGGKIKPNRHRCRGGPGATGLLLDGRP